MREDAADECGLGVTNQVLRARPTLNCSQANFRAAVYHLGISQDEAISDGSAEHPNVPRWEPPGPDLLPPGALRPGSPPYGTLGLYNLHLNFVAHLGTQFFFHPRDQIVGLNGFLYSIKICIYEHNNGYYKTEVLLGIAQGRFWTARCKLFASLSKISTQILFFSLLLGKQGTESFSKAKIKTYCKMTASQNSFFFL